MTLFVELVSTSLEVASTRSRNQKMAAIAAFISKLGQGERRIAVPMVAGRLRQGRVGVGYATVWGGTQVEPAGIPTLEIADVDRVMSGLQAATGEGSQARRQEILDGLLVQATKEEQEYIGRLLVGEVRHGALAGLVLEAVAQAAEVPAGELRRALMLNPELGEVAELAMDGDLQSLELVELQPLHPIQPMLASPAASLEEALGGLSSVEWKLDGARIQVHRGGGKAAVFTRNLRDVTGRMPELVAEVLALTAESFVLDGEALSIANDGRPRPFQETMSRFGTEEEGMATQTLVPYFFDCLYVDGTSLIDRPLVERQEALDRVVPDRLRIPRLLTSSLGEAETFMQQGLKAGHEGVMVKAPSSVYAAGRRGRDWLKVKPVITFDLVVLAAEWGHGRRTGYLSNLHLGARDPRGGPPVMVGKTFKGMTDELLAWQTEALQKIETRRTAGTVWVRPELVVEVALDGVQGSTRYPGGVALRFARIRGYRPDKSPADADTIDSLRDLLSAGR
ncbi:MAG TPA: ATP-dependent DNA ligase [Acidimicrobiia bacterium]